LRQLSIEQERVTIRPRAVACLAVELAAIDQAGEGVEEPRGRLQRVAVADADLGLGGLPRDSGLVRGGEMRGIKIALCSPAEPFLGCAGGHCHDRNRSFDLSPSLAALVRT
jgi:hypothetical protein